MKVQQTESDLLDHLKEQMAFLRASMASYDNGFEGEAKRLAATIRLLVHDTKQSTSLLNSLGVKNNMDFHYVNGDPKEKAKAILSVGGMVRGIRGYRYSPNLVDSNFKSAFDDWWNGLVLVNKAKGIEYSRKDFVLAVANKDGGAHIDQALDAMYADVSRSNGFGWEWDRQDPPFENGPELAIVRQIAHELEMSIAAQFGV